MSPYTDPNVTKPAWMAVLGIGQWKSFGGHWAQSTAHGFILILYIRILYRSLFQFCIF